MCTGVLERNAELVRAALSSLVSDKVKAQTKSLGRSSFRVIVPQSTRSGVMEGEQEIKERGREMDSGCGASEFDGSLEVDGTGEPCGSDDRTGAQADSRLPSVYVDNARTVFCR